jgi:hypothetical protein
MAMMTMTMQVQVFEETRSCTLYTMSAGACSLTPPAWLDILAAGDCSPAPPALPDGAALAVWLYRPHPLHGEPRPLQVSRQNGSHHSSTQTHFDHDHDATDARL